MKIKKEDTMYRQIIWLLFLLIIYRPSFAQKDSIPPQVDTEYTYMYIEGDSIPRQFIDLDEVVFLGKMEFSSPEERREYLLLRRRTRKVYPYAKLASERLYTMNRRLETLETERQKRIYIKRLQKFVEEEFTEEIKNLTKSEGRILMKLIHRQTGETMFELIREYRTGWRAFWYNTTASMFDISLKSEYDPENIKEDFLIEDILQRGFQEGVLEMQRPARPIDYFELADKWLGTNNQ